MVERSIEEKSWKSITRKKSDSSRAEKVVCTMLLLVGGEKRREIEILIRTEHKNCVREMFLMFDCSTFIYNIHFHASPALQHKNFFSRIFQNVF